MPALVAPKAFCHPAASGLDGGRAPASLEPLEALDPLVPPGAGVPGLAGDPALPPLLEPADEASSSPHESALAAIAARAAT